MYNKRLATIAFYSAPPFFVLILSLRIYLETAIFTPINYFSYYTFLHHFLWFFSAALLALVVLRSTTKIPVKKLIYAGYGSPVLLLPILYSLLTNQHLGLEYLPADIYQILKCSLTACLVSAKNRPQFLVILLLDLTVFIIGWKSSSKLAVGIGVLILFHLGLTATGLAWISNEQSDPSLFHVQTEWKKPEVLTLFWLNICTLWSALLMGMEILGKQGLKKLFHFLSAGVTCCLAYAASMTIYAGFSVYEAVTTGLPILVSFPILAFLLIGDTKNTYKDALFYFIVLFVLQICITFPLILEIALELEKVVPIHSIQ